jgi:serine/threonine protein kinase
MAEAGELLGLIDIQTFKVEEPLGEGRFGPVKRCTKYEDPSTSYAVRFVAQVGADGQNSGKRMLREVGIFQTIPHHPVLCRFYGWSLQPPALVLEYLPNVPLSELLDNCGMV